MKLVIALFALAMGAVAFVGSQPASAASGAPSDTPAARCPPPVFECCDGTIGSGPFCANHGGRCFVISICGEPV